MSGIISVAYKVINFCVNNLGRILLVKPYLVYTDVLQTYVLVYQNFTNNTDKKKELSL